MILSRNSRVVVELMDGKMGCGGWWGSLWDIRNEGEGKVVAALLSKQPHAFFFFFV